MTGLLFKDAYKVDRCFTVADVMDKLGILSQTTWQNMRRSDIGELSLQQIITLAKYGRFSVSLTTLLDSSRECRTDDNPFSKVDEIAAEMKAILSLQIEAKA